MRRSSSMFNAMRTVRAGAAVVTLAALSLVPAPAGFADTIPATSCAVAYSVPAQWPGGFEAVITIRNTGSSSINGWSLRFSYPDGQQILHHFSIGTLTQDGPALTLTDTPFNPLIAPNGTVQLGLI